MKSSGFSTEQLAEIPPALQQEIDAGVLSGVVTLLWLGGEIAQVNTLGLRDIERALPMQRDTLFRIASMTKPITSLAALMLIEQGRLRLDDPIRQWAPEFTAMRVLRDPEGPLEDTVPAARDITVEDLLTHRAGLAYGFTSTGPIAAAYQTLGPPLDAHRDPDAWMAALAALPLSYQPGERFHYSHATEVLGFLLGRIEGRPFRDVLLDRILGPLGMADTDFYIPPPKQGRAAQVYRQGTDGGLAPLAFKPIDAPPPFCAGGGGLISTVDDYLKFARLMLGCGEVDGVRLASPETVALMTQNRLTDAQRAIPLKGAPVWTGQGFGLGVSVIVDAAKQAFIDPGANGAFGWPGAYGTWWRVDPANDLIMIYLIQYAAPLTPELLAKRGGQTASAQAVLPRFQRLAYGALAAPA